MFAAALPLELISEDKGVTGDKPFFSTDPAVRTEQTERLRAILMNSDLYLVSGKAAAGLAIMQDRLGDWLNTFKNASGTEKTRCSPPL